MNDQERVVAAALGQTVEPDDDPAPFPRRVPAPGRKYVDEKLHGPVRQSGAPPMPVRPMDEEVRPIAEAVRTATQRMHERTKALRGRLDEIDKLVEMEGKRIAVHFDAYTQASKRAEKLVEDVGTEIAAIEQERDDALKAVP